MHQWVSGPVLQCLHLVLAWVSCLVLWIQYLKSPCWILSLNFSLTNSTHAAWIISLCCPPMICIEGLKLERHYCSHQTHRPYSVHCTDWACHIWWNRSLVCNKRQGDEMLQNEFVIVLNLSFMGACIGMSAGCDLGFWRVRYSAVENINCKLNQHCNIWVKMTKYMSWVSWNLLKKNSHTLRHQKKQAQEVATICNFQWSNGDWIICSSIRKSMKTSLQSSHSLAPSAYCSGLLLQQSFWSC